MSLNKFLASVIRVFIFSVVVLKSTLVFAEELVIVEETKLLASTSEPIDQLGQSSAAHGDFVAVGSINGGIPGVNTGSVHIFQQNLGNWSEIQMLVPDDTQALVGFGRSVTLSEQFLVAGAPDGEAAYVFEKVGTTWVQIDKLVNPHHSSSRFGSSVSISGNYLVVGDTRANTSGSQSGAALVFHYNGESWEEQTVLAASDGNSFDFFGATVAMGNGGAFVVVGGGAGKAYTFRRNGTDWVETAILNPTEGSGNFGRSVATFKEKIVIGDPSFQDDGTSVGAAFLYNTSDGENWTQQATLLRSDAEGSVGFRYVAIMGERIVVGAESDDENDEGVNTGAIYIFEVGNETGTLSESLKIVTSGGSAGDRYGRSVAIPIDRNSGKRFRVIAGAIGDDDNGSSAGAVYIHEIGVVSAKN